MNLESIHRSNKISSPENATANLSNGFRKLLSSESFDDSEVFNYLEENLSQAGFSLANETSVSSILNSNSLICRSESFNEAIDLILASEPIELINEDNHANMCVMAYGEGFKVAMNEGFSGQEVGGVVKVVLTFHKTHLDSSKQIPSDDNLWLTKPNTAELSLAGKGEIALDDLVMVSFRFPVRFYPEELLTDSEQERLDDAEIKFIVRHYIPNHEKTTH